MVTQEIELDVEVAPVFIEEILIDRFEVDEVRLWAEPPLRFELGYEDTPSGRLYLIEGELGVMLAAESKDEVLDMLETDLEFLWLDIAQADPDLMTGDARALRREMRARVRVVLDAP